jgi:hypothetical protein
MFLITLYFCVVEVFSNLLARLNITKAVKYYGKGKIIKFNAVGLF